MDIIKSLFTGTIVGVVFALLKLPIPAPLVFSGIVGIFGIWLGFILINYFIKL